MEDRFDAEVQDVWSALTDPARLAAWYGDVEGDVRVGGEYRARLHASGWSGVGRIEACEPRQRLLVNTTMAANGECGELEVILTGEGDQTRAVWEERGMPVELLAAYGADPGSRRGSPLVPRRRHSLRRERALARTLARLRTVGR